MLFRSRTYSGEKISNLVNDITPKRPKYVDFNFKIYEQVIAQNKGVAKVSEVEMLTDTLGSLQYVGGIYANGKIYFAPNTASQIMVYDTVHEYHYFIGQSLGDYPYKYTGFASYGSYLYPIPRGVNNILRVDPVTDEVVIIDLGLGYDISPFGDYRDSHHYCGVISDDGYMYVPPTGYNNVNELLKIDMQYYKVYKLSWSNDSQSLRDSN